MSNGPGTDASDGGERSIDDILPLTIEGLHFDISARELITHLMGRVSYHESEADRYRQQAVQLEQLGDEIAHASNVQGPRDRMESHMEKLAYFRFMADHVIRGATYRLIERDLTRIEFGGAGTF